MDTLEQLPSPLAGEGQGGGANVPGASSPPPRPSPAKGEGASSPSPLAGEGASSPSPLAGEGQGGGEPYRRWLYWIYPGFKSGHTLYVELVKKECCAGARWLDAGGGRHIFYDLYDGEHELVERASQVVAADIDAESLDGHISVKDRVRCTLGRIPLADDTFDLITCGMVVEHLADPAPVFNELGRILAPGGRLIVHTVNCWGYPTLLAQMAKLIPFKLRRWLISLVTQRQEEDIFPTYYRCNTAKSLAKFVKGAGLEIVELNHWQGGILFPGLFPLYVLEALYLKMTGSARLEKLRGHLLVIATKRTNHRGTESTEERNTEKTGEEDGRA